jgi:hypothetical protein
MVTAVARSKSRWQFRSADANATGTFSERNRTASQVVLGFARTLIVPNIEFA